MVGFVGCQGFSPVCSKPSLHSTDHQTGVTFVLKDLQANL